MVLFFLTNVILDITLGIAWWFTKTTAYVMYNGVCYIININGTKINSKINPKELKNNNCENDNSENEYIIINNSDQLKELQNEIKLLKKLIESKKSNEINTIDKDKNNNEFININDEFTTIN